ncbi:MAG: hypothetical protein ACKV0T_20710 [Planctomycetales bacterium]
MMLPSLFRFTTDQPTAPQTGRWEDDRGAAIEVDLSALEGMGCAIRELRGTLPRLADATAEAWRAWGEDLCRRVTYLLEPLALLEVDSQTPGILIRSLLSANHTEPARYYELRSESAGTVRLRRYAVEPHASQRTPLEFQVTLEVLEKLARDVAEAGR